MTIVVNKPRPFIIWQDLSEQSKQPIIVIDENGVALGGLNPSAFLTTDDDSDPTAESSVKKRWLMPVSYVDPTCPIDDIHFEENKLVIVKDEDGLHGVITREVWYQEKKKQTEDAKKQSFILESIFETAYEGIVIVDQQGLIVQMNRAYRSFLGGMSEQEVIGRPVHDVVENTQLHHVVKSGVPERGKIQVIQGQKMVVHRIPIWQNQKIVGAIGMLIFEGVSELYQILKRMSGMSEDTTSKPDIHNEKVFTFENMVGKSASLQAAKSFARKAARTKASVLITGESGTGKELFARSIHQLSNRQNGPFIALNCAAIPETLLETELFGYEEGSFTGARRGGSLGKFEQATGGTLFLDEVADMSQAMQAKLLRALEMREITKVGGSRTYPINIRLITATNHDLEQKVNQGLFRKDLYYRIHVIHLKLPALEQRKEDIPSLLSHYIDFFAQEYQIEKKEFQEEAIQTLLAYDWPGNIRELVNVVDYVMTICDREIVCSKDLPSSLREKRRDEQPTFKEIVKEQELKQIEDALIQVNGSKSKAAQLLGIHRATLYRKMREYTIL